MEIRKSKEGEVVVIEPEGRIDTTSAHDFEQAVVSELNEGSRCFVVDFSSVEYISSAGLRVLLMLAKRLGGEDEKLALCSMNEHVQEVFSIAGFTSVFSIVSNRIQALKELAAPADTPAAPDRTGRYLALLGAKSKAAAAGEPLSRVATLGYELVTGKKPG